MSKIEEKTKEEMRKLYEDNKEKFVGYPQFDELYEEIKNECLDFDFEKTRQYYIEKNKKSGLTYEIDDDLFGFSFIAEHVGKTTKYGKENSGFFWHLYHEVGMMIDRQKNKSIYCIQDGISPLEQIPEKLKEHF